MFTSGTPSAMQSLTSIWPRFDAAAVCTRAKCPSRRMVSSIPSAVKGLPKDDAPSLAVVPSGNTRHADASTTRYCVYIAPPATPTVLPRRACAAADDPVATTEPAPSLPTGSGLSTRAERPSRAPGANDAVTSGRSAVPATVAVVMSAPAVSKPRSDGLIGEASTRTSTSLSAGVGTGTSRNDSSSVPRELIAVTGHCQANLRSWVAPRSDRMCQGRHDRIEAGPAGTHYTMTLRRTRKRRWGAVHRATRNGALQLAARAGFTVSGTLHLLIAFIILRIARGGGGDADLSGALATIATTAEGSVALWAIVVALIPLALWRLAESIIGLHPAEGPHADAADQRVSNRLKAFGLLLVYCGVAVTAARFAVGSRQSSSRQNAGLSARLMQTDWGRAALIVGGAVIVVIGGYYVYKGASKKFLDDLTISHGRVVTGLGLCGYLLEGVVLCCAGTLLIVASLTTDPAKATGLDAAVKTLGQAPSGQALLLIASVGFAAYGLYSFAMARYSRM